MDSVYIHIVSLGCAKNRIDTEHMLGILADSNAAVVDEPENADVIIVNTCGFINEAKQESIDTILRMAQHKRHGAALIVTGCLAQRYAKELMDELPEVDAFLGVAGYSRLLEAIEAVLAGRKFICCDRIDSDIQPRVLTTAAHLAYVRVADGCSNHCSYCAIPMIRGEFKSRTQESILSEISDLREAGVAEAILIAQDTTRYGADLGGRALPELLDKAAPLMGDGWLRVLYCYPDGVTDGLIEVMLKHENICRYIDLPLQHFSDSVLARMNRRQTCAGTRKLVGKLHEAGFTVRTSLIVGFPGETQDDFDIMMGCVEELRFERLGVFRYSAEDGTPAAELPGQLPDEVKQERYEALMGLQEGISQALCQEQVGRRFRVLVDGVDADTGITIAHGMAQAPQVDGVTYISTKKDLTPGSFHDVLIKDAYEYDLLGELQ